MAEARWIRWCAVLLLGLVALAFVHAAAPHHAAQRHCAACLALTAPGLAGAPRSLQLPTPTSSALAAEPADDAPSTSVRYLRPLRAPPGSAVI
jgi:hypothetical protein